MAVIIQNRDITQTLQIYFCITENDIAVKFKIIAKLVQDSENFMSLTRILMCCKYVTKDILQWYFIVAKPLLRCKQGIYYKFKSLTTHIKLYNNYLRYLDII